MSDHDTALWVEQLSVDIAVSNGTLHAVRQVDFRLERGRTLFLVGESGCGKSMTALALMVTSVISGTIRASRAIFSKPRLYKRLRSAALLVEPALLNQLVTSSSRT